MGGVVVGELDDFGGEVGARGHGDVADEERDDRDAAFQGNGDFGAENVFGVEEAGVAVFILGREAVGGGENDEDGAIGEGALDVGFVFAADFEGHAIHENLAGIFLVEVAVEGDGEAFGVAAAIVDEDVGLGHC